MHYFSSGKYIMEMKTLNMHEMNCICHYPHYSPGASDEVY